MSYQPNDDPAAVASRTPGKSVALAFDRDEWELIVTLPRRVLMAAVTAAPAEGQHAAEGIAGIEAIASGLASSSPLVREVVASIYSESHQEPALLGGADGDGDGGIVQTLAACRYATEILGRKSSPTETAAYCDWLHHIAAVVTGIAQGVAGIPQRGQVDLMDSRFLYALDGILRP